MFRKLNVPILGVVENMSYFVAPDTGARYADLRRGRRGAASRTSSACRCSAADPARDRDAQGRRRGHADHGRTARTRRRRAAFRDIAAAVTARVDEASALQLPTHRLSRRRGHRPTCPIFPLPDLAFFPHTLLPLHIFEPRYRAMVTDSLARDRRLAIVGLKPGYESSYEGRPAGERGGGARQDRQLRADGHRPLQHPAQGECARESSASCPRTRCTAWRSRCRSPMRAPSATPCPPCSGSSALPPDPGGGAAGDARDGGVAGRRRRAGDPVRSGRLGGDPVTGGAPGAAGGARRGAAAAPLDWPSSTISSSS